MAAIRDLLNPLPEEDPKPQLPERRRRVIMPKLQTPTRRPAKTGAIPKDAPLFRAGGTRGEVRYPPNEDRTPELAQIHREWSIFPSNNIDHYPRNIPYQSDKKSFQEKTGRDYFNVFQYTFKVPGEDTEWMIMWDYNIGLVRTTHLFKCIGHTKTAPGRVIANSAGLRDICHSITGGSLAAQGYWMPYGVARAVALTFCWKIRYALTPVFGNDFPDQCIEPSNGGQTSLSSIIVDPTIIRRAAEMSALYRLYELQEGNGNIPPISSYQSMTANPRPAIASGVRSEIQVNEGNVSGLNEAVGARHRQESTPRRRRLTKVARRSYAQSLSSAVASEDEASMSYHGSPTSPKGNTFTAVNRPRVSQQNTSQPSQLVGHPGLLVEQSRLRRLTNSPSDNDSLGSIPSVLSALGSPGGSSSDEKSAPETDDEYMDDDDDEDSEPVRGRSLRREKTQAQGEGQGDQGKKRKKKRPTMGPSGLSRYESEVQAAEALVELNRQTDGECEAILLSPRETERVLPFGWSFKLEQASFKRRHST
ncbi:APSES transcription factor Xbp1 [Penicillium malachiteum]|uniref:APSES transcription factor Xbp1 n=1 Tax=Penicillium malachiteum TaxID=1324776 RepID=UPI00254780BD|nr:APSES transcription factor Xbp1 [Penicillium malachiteum]KAJ5730375.1 APSES transcription factor Xbp1 [Penicillium malachiteum]